MSFKDGCKENYDKNKRIEIYMKENERMAKNMLDERLAGGMKESCRDHTSWFMNQKKKMHHSDPRLYFFLAHIVGVQWKLTKSSKY